MAATFRGLVDYFTTAVAPCSNNIPDSADAVALWKRPPYILFLHSDIRSDWKYVRDKAGFSIKG